MLVRFGLPGLCSTRPSAVFDLTAIRKTPAPAAQDSQHIAAIRPALHRDN